MEPTLTVSPDVSLGDLVTEHPRLARVLEQHGLDYCCGGRQSLGDACAAAGLAVDDVVESLQATDGGDREEWTELAPMAFVDHLEATHHEYLKVEMPRLTGLADKVADVHGGRHPELIEVAATYAELRAELEPHLAKEEQVLFPMVRELASASGPVSFHCGSLRNPISVMMMEHERAGDLLARLRQLTDGYAVPDDACGSYRALLAGLEELEADTHLHVHKEQNVLFPTVVELENRLYA
jgi:regulator of cell morphogenesis and NO signaling